MAKQLGFHFNLARCRGCHSCTIACKSENNTALDVNWRWVVYQEGGTYPNPTRQFVTMACFHCAQPACMAACPVPGAIVKRKADGVVLINQDLCVGCRRCEFACPYGAPQFNTETRKVEKCTFCAHRLDAGLPPACVTSCVGDALHYGDLAEIKGETKIEGFADPGLTTPSVRFTL